MKYTKENIQGLVFGIGRSRYMIDHNDSIPNPRKFTIPSSYWTPERCIEKLEEGVWEVKEWPLKPSEINNNYQIY
jgi:hypothetical protein